MGKCPGRGDFWTSCSLGHPRVFSSLIFPRSRSREMINIEVITWILWTAPTRPFLAVSDERMKDSRAVSSM